MVVGRLLSYWEGNFSGAMLNFGGIFSLYGTPRSMKERPLQRRPVGWLGNVQNPSKTSNRYKPLQAFGASRSLCAVGGWRLVKVEHLSNEKRAPGWLGYIWDYTTILSNYMWDSNKPLHGSFQSFE